MSAWRNMEWWVAGFREGRPGVVRRIPRILPATLAAFTGALAAAAPYTPGSDNEVLERLPPGLKAADARRQRQELAEDPDNLRDSVELAGSYLETARVEGEMRLVGHAQAVLAYAGDRVEVEADGVRLDVAMDSDIQVDRLANGGYAVVRFRAAVPGRGEVSVLTVDYRVFFDVDRLHRGLFQVEGRGLVQQAVFNPVDTRLRFDLGAPDAGREFGRFLREGVWHIWIGYDHILFLMARGCGTRPAGGRGGVSAAGVRDAGDCVLTGSGPSGRIGGGRAGGCWSEWGWVDGRAGGRARPSGTAGRCWKRARAAPQGWGGPTP